MKESVFQTELRKSFKDVYGDSCHFIKIPDMPRFTGETFTFAAVRPYDCFCLIDGKFFAFELKYIKAFSAFPIDRVREHQLVFLKEVERCGGKAYILINYRNSEVTDVQCKKFRLEGKRFNKVFFTTPSMFETLSEDVDRKSISFEQLSSSFGSIDRTGGVWDVRKLINY